jgi:histidine triad (HIT) family protein
MSDDCIFCEIIRGAKPADFVYRNDSLVAFRDIKPAAPAHILVVPRKHIRSINELSADDQPLMGELIAAARGIAEDLGIARSGYKLVFNVERGGGQFVWHLHLHLVGGWRQ